MKRSLLLAMLCAALLALAFAAGCSSATPPASSTTPAAGSSSSSGSTAPSAAGASVSISNFAFDPADLSVKVGTTVTWTNNDSVAHTITAADFDSGSIAPGATFTHTFDKAGTTDYKCSIHPQMTGKITVQ